MPKFVVDEDMPRSTGEILKDLGYDVRDIRDYGFVEQMMKRFTNSRRTIRLFLSQAIQASGISCVFR